MDNEDVLLKVEHLCQYFKMGPGRELKAVDDVSFEIKKGEVFGLVVQQRNRRFARGVP